MREVFARFGLPREIVTDNGPPFTSEQFSQFMLKNGITHKLIPPRHPRSNGAAENAVGQVKRCLKKALTDGVAADVALSRFLLCYRNSQHCTTKKSPSEMLLGRKLRDCMDLLRPNTRDIVKQNQQSKLNNMVESTETFQSVMK